MKWKIVIAVILGVALGWMVYTALNLPVEIDGGHYEIVDLGKLSVKSAE